MKILLTNPIGAFFRYLQSQGFSGAIATAGCLKREDLTQKTRQRLLKNLQSEIFAAEPLIALKACRLVMRHSPMTAERVWAGNQIVQIGREVAKPQLVICTENKARLESLTDVSHYLHAVGSFCFSELSPDNSNQEITALRDQAAQLNTGILIQIHSLAASFGYKPPAKILPFERKAS